MPSLDLRIDNYCFRIDSPNAETCGRWLGDMLTTFPITPATNLVLRVQPFYIPDPKGPWHLPAVPDWEANMQRWDSVSATSPADAVEQFAGRLAKFAQELRDAAADDRG